MLVGDKVKVVNDVPSIDGMLHKNSIVKIDEISDDHPSGSPFRGSIRVTDSLGKIWWVVRDNLTNVT